MARSFLKRIFERKIVISFIAFATVCDLVFTFFILKRYGGYNAGQVEFNPLIRYFIETVGLEFSLFVIVPLIVGTLLLLFYRFWNFKPLRYYAYFLFITRVGLFFYNFYVIKLILQA